MKRNYLQGYVEQGEMAHNTKRFKFRYWNRLSRVVDALPLETFKANLNWAVVYWKMFLSNAGILDLDGLQDVFCGQICSH